MRRALHASSGLLLLGLSATAVACGVLRPREAGNLAGTPTSGLIPLALQGTPTPDPAHDIPPQLRGRSEPIYIATPVPRSTAMPRVVGPFRLFLPGVDPATFTYTPLATVVAAAAHSIDPIALRRSPLFLTPTWLPDGYTLTTVYEQGVNAPGTSLTQQFDGPGWQILISARYVTRLPIDVRVPFDDANALDVVEETQINGFPALLTHQTPRAKGEDNIKIEFVAKNIFFEVTTRGQPAPRVLTVADLQKLTASIILP